MLPKAYDPKLVEEKLTDLWQEAGLFKSQIVAGVKPYVIVIPPPNITGALHMGHALNCSLQDSLIRYHRMLGRPAYWVPGSDHGGIATQNVVEKQLARDKKLTRYDLGREKFIETVWKWNEECGGDIYNQFKKMGFALDLDPKALRFTMDDERALSVYECFKRFWDKKYIYRGKRMINWCVRCNTALSDIEVEHKETNGKLYYIRYKAEDGGEGVTIATTRPETMFADVAVAVNPSDDRYKNLVGKNVILPLMNKPIPVIADEHVDIEFGTGALKITPAHDVNDYEIGKRHNLDTIQAVSDKGKIIYGPEQFIGMDREKARGEVAKALEESGDLIKEEKYKNAVGVCYRCNSPIEPYLSEQWFVKMTDLAAPAIKETEEDNLVFYPTNWKGPFLNWLKNIQDWCISRQIWWGHRIPVWYCKDCSKPGLTFMTDKQGEEQLVKVSFEDGAKPIVSMDKPAECPHCKGHDLVQDPDVLDTWFSSALWPISVFGWPKETEDLKYFYPTTSMVTGYEIIYLWVARMVMMGLEFEGKLPFKDVFLTAIVRDKTGKKMSKSLGNVIDPLDLTAKYGTDAVRFSLLSQSVPGKDIPYDEASIVGPRNFCNKIYNASRFILMNIGDLKGPLAMPAEGKELADRWIIARYNEAMATVKEGFEKYNLSQVANTLYHFLWGDFCDWYIELAKSRFETDREYVMSLLVNILYGTLKALHPLMPFITEEIAGVLKQYVGSEKQFLIDELYPAAEDASKYAADIKEMNILQGIIGSVRAVRSQYNVPPGLMIKTILSSESDEELNAARKYEHYIKLMAKIDTLESGSGIHKPAQCATAVSGTMAVYIPLEGLIDFEKEKARLEKQIAQAEADMNARAARLSDERFTKNAPKEQVEKTNAEYQAAKKKLDEAVSALEDLK
ncbi:valyl-tRNA synthetase [Parelusimicrobium proximum]|uniref:valine--tRNA ligase n=1 Tax=Parelusimicrobium proximum TaxID=3228953 RepID=UPI003D17DA3E